MSDKVSMSKERTEPILEAAGLSKTFKEGDTLLRRLRPDQTVKNVYAVDEVDFAIEPGETLGLVGESGCGKSTLARTVLRLIEPTSGQIRYNGEDITAYSSDELREFRANAQMIFQDPNSSLNPRYTVRKTLIEPMQVHGIGDNKRDRTERALELLKRVGLGPEHIDRYPHEFSGGQRQRVGIARALAVDPQLLVADEPVSALDVSVQAQILNLLDGLQEEMDLTLLFISHNLSVIRKICDRVAVMYLGKVVETAPSDQLFAAPKHPYTQALVSSIPIPDPNVERTRIHLEGDVPTPIDPPSGCRFHPRCPEVIAPNDWPGTDRTWRRVVQFKTRLQEDLIDVDTVRSRLEDEQGPVTDEDVINRIYAEHVVRAGAENEESIRPSEEVKEIVEQAVSKLIHDERTAAVELLDDQFTTVCETTEPAGTTADSREVHCHLYDANKPGVQDSEPDFDEF